LKLYSATAICRLHPDRAGGNAYFKAIRTEIVASEMTREQMVHGWDEVVQFTRSGFPDYPALPLVLPDKTYTSDFTLQDGRIRGIYLGPSHTQDGKQTSRSVGGTSA
jgi:metallo-beta-lactamase class B